MEVDAWRHDAHGCDHVFAHVPEMDTVRPRAPEPDPELRAPVEGGADVQPFLEVPVGVRRAGRGRRGRQVDAVVPAVDLDHRRVRARPGTMGLW
jgi:hypothetical protein